MIFRQPFGTVIASNHDTSHQYSPSTARTANSCGSASRRRPRTPPRPRLGYRDTRNPLRPRWRGQRALARLLSRPEPASSRSARRRHQSRRGPGPAPQRHLRCPGPHLCHRPAASSGCPRRAGLLPRQCFPSLRYVHRGSHRRSYSPGGQGIRRRTVEVSDQASLSRPCGLYHATVIAKLLLPGCAQCVPLIEQF